MNYRYLDRAEVDVTMLELVERLFKDWTKGRAGHIKLLKQLCVAALEGDGRGSYIVLQGNKANGKTLFINILRNLAGKAQSLYFDLNDLMDDKVLHRIDSDYKLLEGESARLVIEDGSFAKSREFNTRFKKLTSNEPIEVLSNVLINGKSSLKLVNNGGLKVQVVKYDVKILDESAGLNRRIRVIDWTDEEFTDKEFSEKLKELVGVFSEPNKAFYEALIYYVMSDMEEFHQFETLD